MQPPESSLRLGRVGPAQATQILLRHAPGCVTTPGLHSSGLDLLLGRLDGLPLALTQAGSYLHQTSMMLVEYVECYDSTWKDLMDEQQAHLGEEYAERSVRATWTLSYQQVQKQCPSAANLLKLWAYLHHDDLWYELVASARHFSVDTIDATVDDGTDELEQSVAPAWLLDIGKSKLKFRATLGVLLKYSLAEAKVATSSYSMHSVLHKWCRDKCSIDKQEDEIALVALGLVACSIPNESSEQLWDYGRRLLPHIRQAGNSAPLTVFASHDENVLGAFAKIGNLLTDHDELTNAQEWYQRAFSGYEKALGPEHPSALQMIRSLGNSYRVQGKLDEAEKMLQRALSGCEKALGVEHTLMFETVNNLGLLYRDQGKLDDAEEMFRRALSGKEKALGPEHTSTLDTVHKLGDLYREQGKLDEAEKMI